MTENSWIILAVNVIGWAVLVGIAYQKLRTISEAVQGICARLDKGDDIFTNLQHRMTRMEVRCEIYHERDCASAERYISNCKPESAGVNENE